MKFKYDKRITQKGYDDIFQDHGELEDEVAQLLKLLLSAYGIMLAFNDAIDSDHNPLDMVEVWLTDFEANHDYVDIRNKIEALRGQWHDS